MAWNYNYTCIYERVKKQKLIMHAYYKVLKNQNSFALIFTILTNSYYYQKQKDAIIFRRLVR